MTLADDRYAALAAKVAALSEQLETASTGLRLTGELYARATEAEAKNIRLERHVRELTRQLAQTDGSDAMRAEYRRGYGAGFHAGRRNGNRDPDQVKRRRRPTTIIPTLGHGSEQ